MSRSEGAVSPDGRTVDLNPGHIHFNPVTGIAQMFRGGDVSSDGSWSFIDLSDAQEQMV